MLFSITFHVCFLTITAESCIELEETKVSKFGRSNVFCFLFFLKFSSFKAFLKLFISLQNLLVGLAACV